MRVMRLSTSRGPQPCSCRQSRIACRSSFTNTQPISKTIALITPRASPPAATLAQRCASHRVRLWQVNGRRLITGTLAAGILSAVLLIAAALPAFATGEDIAAAARGQVGVTVHYDPAYRR